MLTVASLGRVLGNFTPPHPSRRQHSGICWSKRGAPEGDARAAPLRGGLLAPGCFEAESAWLFLKCPDDSRVDFASETIQTSESDTSNQQQALAKCSMEMKAADRERY